MPDLQGYISKCSLNSSAFSPPLSATCMPGLPTWSLQTLLLSSLLISPVAYSPSLCSYIAECFQLVARFPATYSCWFLSRGFFYPEDESDTFIRNVGSHKIYTAPHPRRRYSSKYAPIFWKFLTVKISVFLNMTPCNLVDVMCRWHLVSSTSG
jgi:hypothetical protein